MARDAGAARILMEGQRVWMREEGHMASGRVLVVDDEPEITEVLAEALALDGHEVRRCGAGDEALAAALAVPPDLVLLDVRMPGPGAGGLDGLRVADALAADPRTRGIPVVLMTAASPQERGPWATALAGRGERVLFKPFPLAALLDTVARLLDGRHMQPEQPIEAGGVESARGDARAGNAEALRAQLGRIERSAEASERDLAARQAALAAEQAILVRLRAEMANLRASIAAAERCPVPDA